MQITELSTRPDLIQQGTDYFWKCWGSESNYKFYEDCILHSLQDEYKLQKFYLLLDNDQIVGSYALLTNDIISRQDLMPWFACLFVNGAHRGKGLAAQLLQHELTEANRLGYPDLYLSTNLEGFYKRNRFGITDRRV